jgi:hypothetical protein
MMMSYRSRENLTSHDTSEIFESSSSSAQRLQMALAVSLDQIAQVASADERARLQALLYLDAENRQLKDEVEKLHAGAKLLTAASDALSRAQQREAVALERKAWLVRTLSRATVVVQSTDGPRRSGGRLWRPASAGYRHWLVCISTPDRGRCSTRGGAWL